MAATSSTTYASTLQTKWQKQLLKTAAGYLVADRFANTQVMGVGEGSTVRLNRILRPAKKTSASTAGTLVAASSAKALTSNYIDITMEIWEDSFAFNEDVNIQSFVTSAQNRDVIANHMARTLDYRIISKMATQGLRWRVDNDATYQVTGTVDSASTTTVVDDALTQSDDHWNGGKLTILNPSGPGYDETAAVTDFVASSDTLTVATFTNAPTSASKYSLTVGTNLAATDVLTTDALLYVAALHEKLETEKFDGGLLRMFIDPAQHRDLWTDTTFKNSAIYDSSERFKNYRLGRWFDVEFLVSSEMYRESVAGVEDQAAGVVYVTPVFGANAYQVVRFGNGMGKFGTKFHVVDKPDSQNLTLSATYLSWKGYFGAKVTRATSVIGLMTGATSLGVNIW